MTKQNRMMVTVVVAWSQIRELFVWFQICLNMFIVRTMNLKYGEGVSGSPMIGDIAAITVAFLVNVKVSRTDDSLIVSFLPCLIDVIADGALLWRLVSYENFGIILNQMNIGDPNFLHQRREFIPYSRYFFVLYDSVPIISITYIIIVLVWCSGAFDEDGSTIQNQTEPRAENNAAPLPVQLPLQVEPPPYEASTAPAACCESSECGINHWRGRLSHSS